MAPAVRVGVAAAGLGEFGRAVAAAIAGPTALLTDPCAPVDAEVLVVASWRPSRALCTRVDAAAFTAGRPWLPVVAEHPYIVVGPWIAPPAGPCFSCYTARRTQHDTQARATAGLHAAYDADPSLGPAGHLPHHVRVASGLVQRALAERVPGAVVAYDVHTGRLSTQRVVGVHGCPRCDPAAPLGPRDGRSLPGYLASLWSRR